MNFNLLKNINYLVMPNIFKVFSSIIIAIPILTYYLSIEDIGIIALLTTSVSFFFSIINSKTDWVLQKNFFKYKNNKSKEFIFNIFFIEIILRSLISLFFFVLLFFIIKYGFFTLDNIYIFSLILCFFFNIFSGISLLNYTLFILHKKFQIIFYVDIIKNILNLFLLYYFLKFLNLGILSLFLSLTISAILLFIIELFFILNYLILRINFKHIKEVLFLTKHTLLFNTSGAGLDFFERFNILVFFNLHHVGIYSHAKLYMSFFYNFIKNFLKIFLSEFIKAIQSKSKSSIYRLENIFIDFNCIYFLLSILASLLSYDIIKILTHGKFTESAKYVPFLFLITLTSLQTFINENYIIHSNKIKGLMTIKSSCNIFFIFLMPLFLFLFGVWGIIFLLGLNQLFINFLYTKYFNLRFSFGRFNRSFYKTFFLSFIFLLILLIVNVNLYIKFIILLICIIFLFKYLLKILNNLNHLI
jgi:O-antigen/teichoic acid export membrane protein